MTNPNKRYKIALVGYKLAEGGLEKVMSSLSVYFGDSGIEVHNILLVDEIAYPYAGNLVNIGKMKETHKGFLGKLKLLWFFKSYLKEQRFDYIIDFRYRVKPFQEVLMANWLYKAKTIYTVHSGNITTYIPRSRSLADLIFKRKYAVVCVSDEILRTVEKKYRFQNLQKINNPIDIEAIRTKASEVIDLDFSYVVGMGRFDRNNVKQFDRLIETYLQSDLPEKGIHLVLLGEGETRKALEHGLGNHEKIHFLGFRENPYPYLKKALFFILSSKYEGFPMSLIEALACETPVVAFNCVSGPDEIITDRENGILVANQDFGQLREMINLMARDTTLYEKCKAEAFPSVVQYSIDKIGKQWMFLMEIDVLS